MSNGSLQMEAIVAVATNGVIGRSQSLPWRLQADLKRFRRLTTGHSLLMGRRTFESIGRPLPDRRSWILSRDPALSIPGCRVIQHWAEACEAIGPDEKLFLIGGGELYRQLIDICRVLHITRVIASVEGETTLPLLNLDRFDLTESIFVPSDNYNEFPSIYERWEKY